MQKKGKKYSPIIARPVIQAGKNAMAASKSLSKEDLETNKMNSAAAIIELVTNGKPPMPAFGKLGTLNAADIENVAAYVLKKADAGW